MLPHDSVIKYPSVFAWLSDQFAFSENSQSFVAKAVWLQTTLSEGLGLDVPPLSFLATNYQLLHRVLMAYIALLIGISAVTYFLSKSDRDLLFVVIGLGMALSPNIMWYHHYVFMLLPLLIWIGWSQLDWRVIAWCLLGLLITQVDRRIPPYGLLIHLFGHISILLVLLQQFHSRPAQSGIGVPQGLLQR